MTTMKYHDIFARSFGEHDRKRFGYGALVNCVLVVCFLCLMFKSYLGPPYNTQLRLMILEELKSVMLTDTITMKPYVKTKETKLVCNTTRRRSDTCEMTGDIRIHGSSSTIYVSTSNVVNSTWTIKPYARKGDKGAMQNITKFIIKTGQAQTMPKCTKTHNVPAVAFSIGGYSGNNFHAFSDTIIPLYATSGKYKYNRQVRFLVANNNPRWINKFKEILDNLSNYEIIDIDHENENEVHCFPSMVIGLEKHDHNELNTGSIKDFTKFLRSVYSLNRSTAINLANGSVKRPWLLIVSRFKTRAFTNVQDVVRAAEETGFEVVVTEMSANLSQISRLVNSCDVMMGVHGAGLTNMVFMPQNGVVLQVVPLGNMGWMAKTFYGEPAKGMGLKHLEYYINEVESTLIHKYPRNHTVFKDPYSIQRKGWEVYRSVYMDKQDVTLDVVRFKETLSKAFELLHL